MFIKITLRNLLKNKTASSINIIGLVTGMTCAILIMIYIQYELSFDSFNKNCDRICRVVSERDTPEGIKFDFTSSPPLGNALINDFPNIKRARLLNIDNPAPLIRFDKKQFYEKQLFFADAEIFDIFTIPLLKSNSRIALSKPNTIVITKRIAIKYFGDENPVGQILTLNNFLDLEIIGVAENPPHNSTFNYDFLISFSTLNGWLGNDFINNWQNNTCHTYLLLPQNLSPKVLESKLTVFIEKHFEKPHGIKRICLQPLNRVHLYSFTDYKLVAGGDIESIYLLSAIAAFVLIIACFNFSSITTSQFISRGKEIGIRKLLGASRKQLMLQFLGESFLTISLSLVISVFIVAISIPSFNRIIELDLANDISVYKNLIIIPSFTALLAGILSSIYPAFYLSLYQPMASLRNKFKVTAGNINSRKILVVTQFALIIVLISGTWIIFRQLDLFQTKQLGFDDNKILVIPIRDGQLRQNVQPLKTELKRLANVEQVGAAALLPAGPVGKTGFRAEGTTEMGTMAMLWVDNDFIKTMSIKIVAGRDFSNEFETDFDESFIINEAAVKSLGCNDPLKIIGRKFELANGKKGKIIGVVKDFHFASLQNKIEPVVLHIWKWMNYLLVRTDSKHFIFVAEEIKSTWNQFDPNNPFEYSLLGDHFNRYYESIQRLEKVSTIFTVIAILIASFGLVGLSIYINARRTKEVGIRKVLGASVYSIFKMQLKEFSILVLVAGIIGCPIAYLLMNNWLQNYAYRVNISWWMFVLSGGIALLIALLTVSFQAIKAAVANPIESLRYE
jgi:putative ABC transport system permease protein